jgi:hypothetical protein
VSDYQTLNILLLAGFGGLYLLACGVVGWAANRRGQSGIGFFALAFLLSPLLGFIVLALVGRGGRRTPEDYWQRLTNLEQLRASGQVAESLYPFERAKLELYGTGKRRIFACGRCGKGISLAWKRCDSCKATFDQFPPIPTDKIV